MKKEKKGKNRSGKRRMREETCWKSLKARARSRRRGRIDSKAISRMTAVVIIVILIVAIAGGAAYFVSTLSRTTTTTNTSRTTTSISSSGSTTASSRSSSLMSTSLTSTMSNSSSSATISASCSSTLIAVGYPTVGALTYDPDNGYLYAATQTQPYQTQHGTVSAQSGIVEIDPSTNHIVRNVSIGFDPYSLGYNPLNGVIYGSNYLYQAATFNPSTGNVTRLGLYGSFLGLTQDDYVPSLKVFYGFGGAIVNASSYQLISYVNVTSTNSSSSSSSSTLSSPTANSNGQLPFYWSAYDSLNGLVYVAGYSSGSVYAINPQSNTLVANISLGAKTGPSNIAVDTSNGYLYVTEVGTYTYGPILQNVSVIDTKTNAIVKTISLGPGIPGYVVYAKQSNKVFVMSMPPGGGAQVLGIDDRTNAIVSNTTIPSYIIQIPSAVAYDPQNDCLYVTGSISLNPARVVGVPTT